MTITNQPPDEKPKKEKKNKGPSESTQLVKMMISLCQQWNAELFRCPNNGLYIYTPVFVREGVLKYMDTMLLDSERCRTYMRRMYFNTAGKTTTSSALRDAIETLEGKAAMGPVFEVYSRIYADADRVLIDQGNDERTCVIITAQGWSIGPCPDGIRFIRPTASGMLPLVDPIRNDEPLTHWIPQILNVHADDLDNMLMLISWWIVALRGLGPFTVLVIRGGAGSAKSNALVIARAVLDPNTATKNSVPKDERDMVIAVKNCYVLSIDNVSHLPEDISDAICKLSTGGGIRTRKLHSDSDEVIFNKKAPVALNGIPDVIGRSDLASRCVIVEMQPISDTDRKTEAELDIVKAFVVPRLLAKLYDATVGVLSREKTTRPLSLPRMADVAITLTAAEETLGLPDGTFIALLNKQADEAADAQLESNDDLIPALMAATNDATTTWVGELKDLIGAIPPSEDPRKPWTAKRLANALRRLDGAALARVNLQVRPAGGQAQAGEGRGKRLWMLKPIVVGGVGTTLTSGEDRQPPAVKDLPF